jgi:uncharacterized protein YeaO (DUF488 family)
MNTDSKPSQETAEDLIQKLRESQDPGDTLIEITTDSDTILGVTRDGQTITRKMLQETAPVEELVEFFLKIESQIKEFQTKYNELQFAISAEEAEKRLIALGDIVEKGENA